MLDFLEQVIKHIYMYGKTLKYLNVTKLGVKSHKKIF